jgi:nucleoid-associated protein YgaU
MTSDAKVGVLLGLVFIFIVAFLINGLGDLKTDEDNNELTTQMVRSYKRSPGLGSSERKASQKVIEQIKPVEPDLLEIWEQSRGEADELRFSAPLPVVLKKEETADVKSDTGLEDLIKVEVMKAEAPATVTKTEPEKDEAVKVTAIKPPKPRIYVVKSGDNLASIAKEVYGEEEGNRMVNVKRIYEVNREQLKSPDEVYEGQKLIIPPHEDIGFVAAKPGGILPEVLVEAVDSIGRRHLEGKETKDVKKSSKKGRWYEVKENDNLWKIAVSELGDGNRYAEIAKLNAEVLNDEDSLDIGMRLKLPVD